MTIGRREPIGIACALDQNEIKLATKERWIEMKKEEVKERRDEGMKE
jgi:hypothetical protein